MTTAVQEFEYIEDNEQENYTNDQTQVTSNINQYEYQKSPKMNGINIRKRKWSSQSASQKYHQNDSSSFDSTYKYSNKNKNKHHYRNKTYNNLKSKQPSQECEAQNDDSIKIKKYNLENTVTDNIHYEHHTSTVEPQKSKTPITLLNEWAMRGNGSYEKKPFMVTYTLVDISGHAHKPIFTYICQVNDKTAKGDGQSKKEAKQNAAAQMWKKVSKDNSITNNDKVITSTTITDNFEVNENDTTNLTSTEGSQTTNETDSIMGDEKLEPDYDSVKIAHCNMNPVGALQELSTSYKWTPPFYSFQKLGPLDKDQYQNRGYKSVSYKVTCKVFHLQTTGIANTKKEAKRLAARLMFDEIRNISEEKLNTLRSIEFKNDYEQDEDQKSYLEWNSALCFQSYFTAAISEVVNTKDLSILYFSSESEENEEINIKREYQKKLLESIEQFNPNLSAVDQLQALSQQLHFQAMYMCVNDMDYQKQKINNNQDIEYTVMIQVTSIPLIVAMGQANSLYEAAEIAATSILQTFKNMLMYTSSLIQNEYVYEQDKVMMPFINVL